MLKTGDNVVALFMVKEQELLGYCATMKTKKEKKEKEKVNEERERGGVLPNWALLLLLLHMQQATATYATARTVSCTRTILPSVIAAC